MLVAAGRLEIRSSTRSSTSLAGHKDTLQAIPILTNFLRSW